MEKYFSGILIKKLSKNHIAIDYLILNNNILINIFREKEELTGYALRKMNKNDLRKI